jgi:hypothetical protein
MYLKNMYKKIFGMGKNKVKMVDFDYFILANLSYI